MLLLKSFARSIHAWVKRIIKEIVGDLCDHDHGSTEQELLQTTRDFHSCKQEEGQSVSSYHLKMKGYIDNLEHLGHPVTLGLAVSLILIGLRKEFAWFVQNYNMHSLGDSYAMLKAPWSKLLICPKNNAPAYMLFELGLKRSRKLKPGALSLSVGDGHRAAVEAIRSYHLCLPSGLVLVLHNCHFAPFITRGIILVSRLYDNGFINPFENNTILVSRNNVVYFSVIPRNGIFKIDLSNSNTNDSSMYVVSNKRAKINLDATLLWHCRLGHISKKLIETLKHDGLINSTDNQSFDKCVSCMSRKMARKPYTHQVERAKDLLGLIHTDVYGPFKTVSKQGASYFEVENQLRKTIKSLRSDRRGEYMSQEFLDHLKEHGIIAHRTPPYTPQHNGVSERRNRTLLDMVRSMMSQATLPKSFWDYALESAERILNMVPTKKAKKIPYKIWHGQSPKLGSLEDLEIIQEEDTHHSVNTSLDHDEDDQEIDEPQSDINPIHHESKKWLDAMNVEMQSMKDNEVWDLVDLPPDGKTIGSKRLFKKKNDMDGAVHTYKARLVVKGFTQTYRVDYEETFSTIADVRAIRILVAITAFYDYEIWQMDVKTAFLNGHLSEEVYMVQLEGFVNPKYPNQVCKLKCSIYGLRQESRQ
ncbi:retrotransposon protein, putative, ty1-copia subclass [Tanacetum coccineum]